MDRLFGNRRHAHAALCFLQRVNVRWDEVDAAVEARDMLEHIAQTGELPASSLGEELSSQQPLPFGQK